MFFIGQEHIMPALGDNLVNTYMNKTGIALLFRGASGYGKTELAKRSCNFLVGRDYQWCLGNAFEFDEKVWVHFIDEIHLMKEPETLFPLIDSGKFVFVFATNYDSVLPEALVNRCQSYIFTEYSDLELIEIFKVHSTKDFSNQVIQHVINVSNRNPRVMIKTFLHNMEIHFSHEDLVTKSDQEIIEETDKLHGIVGEMDKISRQYLEVLKNLGGRASINVIEMTLKLDVNTIKYTIEPALLYKGLIKITSRGRELCQ